MAYVSKINGYDIKDSEARGDVSTLQESMTTAQSDIEILQNDLSDTKADLGDVTQLETTDKTDLVSAINEVKGEADDNASSIAQNTDNFAPAFSEVTSYAVGNYVTYNNILYRCTTAHSAGVWVAGHFTQVTVGGTLGDIVPNDASASNKLITESKLSYSTSETKTGATWINGNPIYRKVVTHTISTPLTGIIDIPHGIQNIDTPIRIVCGKAYANNINSGIIIPAQYNTTTFIHISGFNVSSVQLFAGSENWTQLSNILLCLEYTKTTD